MLLLFIILIFINNLLFKYLLRLFLATTYLLFNIYTLPSHMYVDIGRLMGIN